VGPNLARTSLPGEKLVGIDAELPRLFDNTESVIHFHISDFLESTLRTARDRIREAFRSDRESRHLDLGGNALIHFLGSTTNLPASSLRSAVSILPEPIKLATNGRSQRKCLFSMQSLKVCMP
jgi:hypothetical protein